MKVAQTISTPSKQKGGEPAAYETRRWLYFLALPVMWMLIIWVMFKKRGGRQPKINTLLFDGISPVCREIKEGATTWRALDIIYNHKPGSDGVITNFWLGMMNAQAVRNRKRLVESLLVSHIRAMGKREVRLLSLASGSAQSVIETLAFLKREGISVHAVLADIDSTALEHSLELAQRQSFDVENQITTLQIDIRRLLRLEQTLKDYLPFDVVEMVGFLEYFQDRGIVKLMETIHRLLQPGGFYLTSSIRDNPERWFLHWVINWEMIYRSKETFSGLLKKAGFQNCEIVTEPQGVFYVAVCRN